MKESEPVIKTTIRVPQPLWDAARIRAVQDHMPVQDLVIKALAQYLKGGRR